MKIRDRKKGREELTISSGKIGLESPRGSARYTVSKYEKRRLQSYIKLLYNLLFLFFNLGHKFSFHHAGGLPCVWLICHGNFQSPFIPRVLNTKLQCPHRFLIHLPTSPTPQEICNLERIVTVINHRWLF